MAPHIASQSLSRAAAVPPRRGRIGRRGFTLLELLIVIVVGGILTSITFVSFSRVHGQLGSSAAATNFLSLHSQARAVAVERGGLATFILDQNAATVRIEFDGAVINQLDLGREFDVTVDAGGNLTQCFTPRGIADLGCTTFERPVTVSFTRGNRTAQVELLPLGQARSR